MKRNILIPLKREKKARWLDVISTSTIIHCRRKSGNHLRDFFREFQKQLAMNETKRNEIEYQYGGWDMARDSLFSNDHNSN